MIGAASHRHNRRVFATPATLTGTALWGPQARDYARRQYSGQDPDPLGSLPPEDWQAYVTRARDEGSQLVAVIVAYGSVELKEILGRLKPIQSDFWANVYEYRNTMRRPGGAAKPPSDYYVEAHKIRERFEAVRGELHVRIETELMSPAPAIAPA